MKGRVIGHRMGLFLKDKAEAEIQETLMEMLPTVVKTLCELMVCKDKKVRSQAKALWRNRATP